MSHLNNDGICEYVFKKGAKKGKVCSYKDCKTHDEYDCNLARYLNLPSFFNNTGKKIPTSEYFMLIKILENIVYDKQYLINCLTRVITNMEMRDVRIKELLAIYMYVLLDTKPVTELILVDTRFKNTICEKFKELIESPEASKEFVSYMVSNFVTGKRFLSIRKNSEYKTRIFRVYMKTLVICNEWYIDTMEKRYAPGGNGAIEAEKNFVYLSSNIKIY
jgi:hypothetical protein